MPRQRLLAGFFAAAASLFGLGCSKAASGRYTMSADPGSRLRFQYVLDRVTGLWTYREFEMRVDTARPMPEPISDDEHGDRVSLQMFKPGMAKSGGLRSGTPVIEGGYRVWRGADVADENDLIGRAAYGVTVVWPVVDDQGAPHDPLEIFQMPPLAETEPGVWSPWSTAATMRQGGFGWWEQVHGKALDSIPLPKYPFEFRWRLLTDQVPGRLP